jgi:phage pi2 protein 07
MFIVKKTNLWKFSDFKHYTSLKLIAHVLDIPSPKEDIDRSMGRDVYYQANDLERFAWNCEPDFITKALVYRRLGNEKLLRKEQIL